jgi:hypothetical protein
MSASGPVETDFMIKESFAAVLIGLTLPAAAQVRSGSELNTKLVVPALTLPDNPQSADAIICRPPQQLPGQRLYGPQVCRPQRQWDDLHQQGLDIGPDGQSVVASEKFRTLRGCKSQVAC